MVKVSLLIKSPKTEVKDFVNVSCERENVKVNVSFRLVCPGPQDGQSSNETRDWSVQTWMCCLLACLLGRAGGARCALAVCRIN